MEKRAACAAQRISAFQNPQIVNRHLHGQHSLVFHLPAKTERQDISPSNSAKTPLFFWPHALCAPLIAGNPWIAGAYVRAYPKIILLAWKRSAHLLVLAHKSPSKHS
jgi:hypothetical protein